MRKLAYLALALVAVALLLPPALGYLSRSKLEDLVSRANQQMGQTATISLHNYQQGWFASEGEIQFRFTDAYIASITNGQNNSTEANALVRSWFGDEVSQSIDIKHGPIIAGDALIVGLGQVRTQIDGSVNPSLAEFLGTVGNAYLIRTEADIGLNGMGEFRVHVPAFNYTMTPDNGEPATILFAGMSSSGEFDISTLRAAGEGQMNGISVEAEAMEMIVEHAAANFDLQSLEDNPTISIGKITASIERILVLAKDGMALDVKNPSFVATAEMDESSLLNGSITYRIADVATADDSFENLVLTLAAANIEPNAISELNEYQQSMAMNANADPAEMLAQLAKPLYQLLRRNLSISVQEASMIYNGQPLAATFAISSQGERLPAEQNFNLMDPSLWMAIFKADMSLELHKDLAGKLAVTQLRAQLAQNVPEGTELTEEQLDTMAAAQAPMMLNGLVGQGFLQERGSSYLIKASYQDGALKVNGNPYPLGPLMSMGQGALQASAG